MDEQATKVKRSRNRNETTLRIINALEEEVSEYGVANIGVNRIAERAGVSKVLIYRYFGGVDGLLRHYIKMGRLFPLYNETTLEHLKPVDDGDLAKVWYKQVTHTYRVLRNVPAGVEVLRATVQEGNTLAETASRAADEEMTRLVDQLSFVKSTDTRAISAVMLGAMSYMTLMSKQQRTVIGIDLSTEEGWTRVENAVRTIYTAINNLLVERKASKVEAQKASLSGNYW